MREQGTTGEGLTLIETVISTVIMALLTTMLLVGSVSARRGYAVRSGAEQLAGFLRETAALTIREEGCGTNCFKYKVQVTVGARTYYRLARGSSVWLTRSLPAGTKIESFVPSAACPSPPGCTLDFVYAPPALKIQYGPNTLIGVAWIEIRHVRGGASQYVCVRGNGLIEVRSVC